MYKFNKYYSIFIILFGVALLGVSLTDANFTGVHITCALLVTVAGIVSVWSNRRHSIIWLALALDIASYALAVLSTKALSDTPFDICCLLMAPAVFISALRMYWLETGREDKPATPEKRLRSNPAPHAKMRRPHGKTSGSRQTGTNARQLTREQQKAVEKCRRDLYAAMDDGYMEELEDIVQEQLGDGWKVDDLI